MPITAVGYDLLGVSLRSASSLDETIHLEFEKGTSALYGLNGAGKTSILRSTKDALCGTGEASGTNFADLHFHLHAGKDTTQGHFIKYLSDFMTNEISRLYGKVFSPNSIDENGVYVGDDSRVASSHYFIGEDPGRKSDHLTLQEKLDKYIELHSVDRELTGDHLHSLKSIAANGRLTLRSEGDNTWSLWLSASGLDGNDSKKHVDRILEIVQSILTESWSPRNEDDADRVVEAVSALTYCNSTPSLARSDVTKIDLQAGINLHIPLIQIGDGFTQPAVRYIDDNSAAADLDQYTLEALIEEEIQKLRNSEHGQQDHLDTQIRNNIEAYSSTIAKRANDFMNHVLPSAPSLRFNLRTNNELLVGIRPTWEFARRGQAGPPWPPIEKLSNAQLRWAKSCVTLALAENDELPAIFICDEPESGLHRLAERKMASGLAELSAKTNVNIITATHSSQLLNSPKINKTLVYRSEHNHFVMIRPLKLGYSDNLELLVGSVEIGLSFSDVLQMMQVAVIVEGLHDEVVLKQLLQNQLNEAQASIMPMRGAKRLKSLAEARFIFLGTQAKILVVVDNIENTGLIALWSNIVEAAKQGDLDLARRAAATLSSQKTDEAVYLGELASAALEIGNIDRIEVHGLAAPDIICYLPEREIFGANRQSWTELIADWTRTMNNRPTNIKGFLKKRKLLPQDPLEVDQLIEKATRAASRNIEFIQPDIVKLGERIVEISQRN
ncbi:hypothetical protein RhoFasSB10_03697 [Rhodococcus fascians]|uniref:hypothetical protein n=1 Tax=Rhodococcoides fascians TaxID=1828 RepID=UPI001427B095|nr:hypothetical protein [Rhodococcus fascians]